MVKAFRKLGHQVHVVSLVETPEHITPVAIKRGSPERADRRKFHLRVPFLAEAIQLGYNLAGLPMVLWAMRDGSFDFLYERHSLFNFSGVLAAKLTGRPIVIEVNSPLAVELSRDGAIQSLRLSKWVESTVLRMATRVIVVSSPLARIVESMGVESARIDVVPNGVDLERFNASGSGDGLRQQLGLGTGVVIGFAGWLKKWHGVELLLKAFHDHGLSPAGARLLILGDGPAMADLRAFVRSHNMEHAVVFSGAIRHDQMPGYLSILDVAVQPAANEYCCPMKILEYMSLGKPIVAPRQENILDLLRENEAILFEPENSTALGEALEQLVVNPNLRAAVGAAALTALNSRRYLWTENASRVVEVLLRGRHIRAKSIPLKHGRVRGTYHSDV